MRSSAGRRKLDRKGVDLLVVNDVSAPGAGFDHDTNAVVILDADGIADGNPPDLQGCSGKCAYWIG